MKTMLRKAAILAFGIILAGCVQEETGGNGRAVRFGARTEMFAITRTTYSGEVTSDIERINWDDGDEIRIYSNEVSSPSEKYADYVLTRSENSGIYSYATAAPSKSDLELLWGSGTHSFFSVYPAPSSNAVASGDPNLSYDSTGGCGIVDAILETNQSASTHTTEEPETYYGNMDLAYMTAAATGSRGDVVTLSFTPIVTTFYVTVTNTTGKDMTLRKVALSSGNRPLTGGYRTTFTAANVRTYTYYDGESWASLSSLPWTTANSEIYSAFPSGLTLTSGTSVIVALFALPIDITQLTLTVTSDETGAVSLPMKRNGDWITFTGGNKHNLNNINVPSVEYVLTVDKTLLTYDDTGTATSAQRFTVTHKKTISSTASPMPWKTQIKNTSDDEWVDLEGNCPDWLVNFPLNSAGKTTANASIADEPAVSHSYQKDVTAQPVTSHEEMLKAAPPVGSADEPLDLSKWDFVKKVKETRYTANCYVVQAPGWYCFPIVYGNGIENDHTVRASYEGAKIVANHLDKFKKMNDFSIYAADGAPWLEKSSITSVDYHHSSRLQWQKYSYWDETSGTVVTTGNNYSGYYKVWPESSRETVTNPLEVIKDLEIYSGSDGYYMKFFVDSQTIRPGNALIASISNDNKIAWSWHIWITDQDMTPITVGNHQVLPVNLGWIDTEKGLFYKERSRQIRFVSTEKEGMVSEAVTVIQPELTKESTQGWNTYYQWGRKDPLAEYLTIVYDDDALLYDSIKHPNNIQYDGGHEDGIEYFDWTSANYNNLWDSKWTEYGVTSDLPPNHKTVYDPSPRKFCVSPDQAWDVLVSSGHKGSFENGYHFYTSSDQTKTIFFPAAGYMHYLDAEIKSPRSAGRYWTNHAVFNTQRRESFCLYFNSSPTSIQNKYYSHLESDEPMHRAYGYPVRPVVFDETPPGDEGNTLLKEVVFGDYWNSYQANLGNHPIEVKDADNTTLFQISFDNGGTLDLPKFFPRNDVEGEDAHVSLGRSNTMTITAVAPITSIVSVSFTLDKEGTYVVTTTPADHYSDGTWFNHTYDEATHSYTSHYSTVVFQMGNAAGEDWRLTGLLITYEDPSGS